jgi:hypothetical protein
MSATRKCWPSGVSRVSCGMPSGTTSRSNWRTFLRVCASTTIIRLANSQLNSIVRPSAE